MVKSDILLFYDNPIQFSEQVSEESKALWLSGLNDIAIPLIESHSQNQLRSAQVNAWQGIANNRASLVLGPPGTGKTFILSWMALGYFQAAIKANRKCRIFVTAFTKNAIINMLEAIAEKINIYFPGTNPNLYYFSNDEKSALKSASISVINEPSDEISVLQQNHAIIGCTSWKLYKILNGKNDLPEKEGPTAPIFDLICIDEASQMVIGQGLLSLIGLSSGGRVLVAGDNKQLAPIRKVKDPRDSERRFGQSLYDFLKNNGVREFPLDETFRMNIPLTAFPSEAFYEGNFYSAGDAQERRWELKENWQDGLEPWQKYALDPDEPVCILLHDGPPYGTHNPFEVSIVRKLVKLIKERVLLKGENNSEQIEHFWQDQLAVISPHKAQNASIKQSLEAIDLNEKSVVETVDRIQGRERDAIIASYTVSDAEFAMAEDEFIFSPERFNVTITRARSKLILIISRRLFEIVPDDENIFDYFQVLREFVYSSVLVGDIDLPSSDGGRYNVSVRLRRFDDTKEILPLDNVLEKRNIEPIPELTEDLQKKLNKIVELARNNSYGTVTDYELKNQLIKFEDIRALFLNGWLVIAEKQGEKGPFLSIKPLANTKVFLSVDEKNVRENIEEVIENLKSGRFAPFYDSVRNQFFWLSSEKEDALKPILDKLVSEGLLEWKTFEGKKSSILTIDNKREIKPEAFIPTLPAEEIEDDDFIVLNCLEDLEAKRINFGIYEKWSNYLDIYHSDIISGIIKDKGWKIENILNSLRRLLAHGYIMQSNDSGRIRSRIAELAREVRYVKQRFQKGDALKRPFLVRAMKLEILNRDKPIRNVNLIEIQNRLLSQLNTLPIAQKAITSLVQMLQLRWKDQEPKLAAFQKRALEEIFLAWVGLSRSDSFVITADTGSGKTEAACLPLIAGALYDKLQGIKGTKNILVYPRILLASNQAQRLVGYLSSLEKIEGLPTITLGIQNGLVPKTLSENKLEKSKENQAWKLIGEKALAFPFFGCPDCNESLHIIPGAGNFNSDKLLCPACNWNYKGWVGSKEGLKNNPPDFFLPVTESLHQWLQRHEYTSIFGNNDFSPAKAILADEIHLYSHIHGSQVGYTLRRVLQRSEEEMAKNGLNKKPLAIGMSATLGSPRFVWKNLVGRDNSQLITPEKNEKLINPKSREYFIFVQPEIESRGADIAGTSTTIQSLMCIAHGMRRRASETGGYRSLVFLDSIDKLKRMHSDFLDAEEGKNLSQFRTYLYNDDPVSGQKRRTCCRTPESCDTFKDGECWYFAATDNNQVTVRGRYSTKQSLKVCNTPIYSKGGSSLEEIIRSSDIVFSTSTLEVGFDDPDLIMVYQHYSPTNIASFIQRKGRGGRGVDDRPVTGVTLSVYSPKDSWYFNNPKKMLNSADFEIPVNNENYFVLRGQVLSVFFDCLARNYHFGRENLHSIPAPIFREADRMTRAIFGEQIYLQLNVESIEDFFRQALSKSYSPNPNTYSWRENFTWIPDKLFDSGNLPMVSVQYEELQKQKDSTYKEELKTEVEEIQLVISQCSPGNMTRRYARDIVHWIPPLNGPSLFTQDKDFYSNENYFSFSTGKNLLEELPIDARSDLKDSISNTIYRPTNLKLVKGGKMFGALWVGDWFFNKNLNRVEHETQAKNKLLTIGNKSRSTLRKFIMIKTDENFCSEKEINPVFNNLLSNLKFFASHANNLNKTGLTAANIFWGSDTELELEDSTLKKSREYLHQTFIHPETKIPLLHGYQIETEGIQVKLNSEKLDEFINLELDYLENNPMEKKWYYGQFLRYLAQARLKIDGLNTYQAKQISEIMVTANAFEDKQEKLRKIIRSWDPDKLLNLLIETYTDHLSQHPVLSERRINGLKDALNSGNFGPGMKEVMDRIKNEFSSFLRSVLLHSIAIRLNQLFIQFGKGEERKILFHAKLPLQFGNNFNDAITVFENGEYGDGTTRTFEIYLNPALENLLKGGFYYCPNAIEDWFLEKLLEHEDKVEKWRSLDIKDLNNVIKIAHELTGRTDDKDLSYMQSVIKVLFGIEEVETDRFYFYDLFKESYKVRQSLKNDMKREPTVWELVSTVVSKAKNSPTEVPDCARLLKCYQNIENSSQEDSLSSDSRLADQIYRLSAKLCSDGCRTCLHTASTLMEDSAVENTVSRNMMKRFSDFIFKGEEVIESEIVIDLDLFKNKWHNLVKLLSNSNIEIDGGSDILVNDRVIGEYFAKVTFNGKIAYLVESGQQNDEQILDYFITKNYKVIEIKGSLPDITNKEKIVNLINE
jgi:hypothetical protein